MNRKDQKLIWEAYAGFRPVQSKYIYFVDSGEVYQTNPYKLVTNDISTIDSTKMFPGNVKQIRVALGEDLNDLGIVKLQPEDFRTWYVVDNRVPQDHSHEAIIAEAYTLRDPNVSDKVVSNLTAKVKKLKSELEFIKQAMGDAEYNNNYDPQARLYHQKRLKEIPTLISRAKKQYFDKQ